MTTKSYQKKIIFSGDIVEVYEYEKPILEGYENKNSKGKGRSSEADLEEKEKNRELVLTRARRDLRRLINSNVHMYGVPSKFLTLTFAENVKTFEVANYEWKKFKQRLEDYTEKCLKYVVVPEFQKRGAIHFHVIFFNLPFIKANKIKDIWGNGFIKINKIDHVDNVGAYICKYMTKDNDDERLIGKKCYFSSRGLYKPIEEKEKSRVDSLATVLPTSALTYSSTFENDYNCVSYKQYNMNKIQNE